MVPRCFVEAAVVLCDVGNGQGEVSALDLGADGAQWGVSGHIALGGRIGVFREEWGQLRRYQGEAVRAGNRLCWILYRLATS
ncbi:hypothetical protein D3C81_1351880 [compost metagenome]